MEKEAGIHRGGGGEREHLAEDKCYFRCIALLLRGEEKEEEAS